jgi:proteic killer suppression protein
MRLARFRHTGLRQFYTGDDAKGLSAATVDKLRKLIFALEAAGNLEQAGRFRGWRLRALRGDRDGFWSLTVTGNWLMVFRYDEQSNTVSDIDLVDYHQEAQCP